MTIVYLLLLSCISACLYRMGGCGPADLEKEWGWVPKFIRNFPKKRDVGSNICALLGCVTVGLTAPWWIWVICFGLMWASLSTYWDFLFGFDNHWFHGFMCGVSLMPLAFYGSALALGINCLLLAVAMGAWSLVLKNATWEELGRGAFLPLTLLCVLV